MRLLPSLLLIATLPSCLTNSMWRDATEEIITWEVNDLEARYHGRELWLLDAPGEVPEFRLLVEPRAGNDVLAGLPKGPGWLALRPWFADDTASQRLAALLANEPALALDRLRLATLDEVEDLGPWRGDLSLGGDYIPELATRPATAEDWAASAAPDDAVMRALGPFLEAPTDDQGQLVPSAAGQAGEILGLSRATRVAVAGGTAPGRPFPEWVLFAHGDDDPGSVVAGELLWILEEVDASVGLLSDGWTLQLTVGARWSEEGPAPGAVRIWHHAAGPTLNVIHIQRTTTPVSSTNWPMIGFAILATPVTLILDCLVAGLVGDDDDC